MRHIFELSFIPGFSYGALVKYFTGEGMGLNKHLFNYSLCKSCIFEHGTN
jgi:hypothetical protein